MGGGYTLVHTECRRMIKELQRTKTQMPELSRCPKVLDSGISVQDCSRFVERVDARSSEGNGEGFGHRVSMVALGWGRHEGAQAARSELVRPPELWPRRSGREVRSRRICRCPGDAETCLTPPLLVSIEVGSPKMSEACLGGVPSTKD